MTNLANAIKTEAIFQSWLAYHGANDTQISRRHFWLTGLRMRPTLYGVCA
jgi:hypothetical protein